MERSKTSNAISTQRGQTFSLPGKSCSLKGRLFLIPALVKASLGIDLEREGISLSRSMAFTSNLTASYSAQGACPKNARSLPTPTSLPVMPLTMMSPPEKPELGAVRAISKGFSEVYTSRGKLPRGQFRFSGEDSDRAGGNADSNSVKCGIVRRPHRGTDRRAESNRPIVSKDSRSRYRKALRQGPVRAGAAGHELRVAANCPPTLPTPWHGLGRHEPYGRAKGRRRLS